MIARGQDFDRIVITGVGLTAPNGNSLPEFRQNLLAGRSGVVPFEIRYFGSTVAGVCNFDELRYQRRKDLRRGTRAGSIGIYCAREAIADSGLDWENVDRSTVGIYVGVTEHGNVETENEIYLLKGYDYDTQYWSHHHNPRTVANNPAGEISLNLSITGPHYTLGAACAAGNAGIIQGVQMLRLGDCDVALAGGVSESIHTFGIFASFHSQGALRGTTTRPRRRGPSTPTATASWSRKAAACSCWSGWPTPRPAREDLRRSCRLRHEQRCPRLRAASSAATGRVHAVGPARAGMEASEIDIVNTHATGTASGDIQEVEALRRVFAANGRHTLMNNTKSFIGHAMGAAGALELAGNLPAFDDGVCHATINLDRVEPDCAMPGLVANQPREMGRVRTILNNSFGMLGINSVVIVRQV